jgi:hypothetical protein
MSFIPEGYNVPSSSGKYLKFKVGDTKFRIMSSPVMGTEAWTFDKKPVRCHLNESIDISGGNVDESSAKHFWAMIVYDYADKLIKILEITQKSLQQFLTSTAKDPDWGSPVGSDGYDIVVTKTGEGKDGTKYSIRANPHKKLEDGIEQVAKDMNLNLEALFSGADPFAGKPVEEIDAKEVDKIFKGK